MQFGGNMEHAFLSRPEPRITGNPKRGPGRPWEFVAQSLVNPDIDDGMALGGSNPISTSQHVRVSIPRRYCIVSVVCLIEFHLYIEPVFRIKDPSGVAGSMEAVDEFESAQARQMTFVHFMGASNSLQLGAASYSTVVFSGYFPQLVAQNSTGREQDRKLLASHLQHRSKVLSPP